MITVKGSDEPIGSIDVVDYENGIIKLLDPPFENGKLNPRLYKIKFPKDSYAWLYSKDRTWGGNQTIEETESGYILSFEASQFKPVLRWILGWGDEAAPLEPPELVAEWKEKVRKMAERV